MAPTPDTAIAAHRFGLGEPQLAALPADAAGLRRWLLQQIGPADPQRSAVALPGFDSAWAVHNAGRGPKADDADKEALRQQVQADVRARLLTAATTERPFAERLALFWSNHFTVSLVKGAVQGLVGAFEREAIRPHIAGRFADLLAAATLHPTMLRYLDNQLSAGPQSRVAQRAPAAGANAPRISGLNENLARELLELHTLGVAGGGGLDADRYGPWGGYTQADVTALAAVLTGWRGPPAQRSAAGQGALFDARFHQPGPKTVLGKRYGEGPQALRQVLDDLARHPSTARFVATKLARHLVADHPPRALVDTLARRFSDTDGDLAAVYATLIDSPLAWQAAPAKLRTPEEFVVASARLLRLAEPLVRRAPDGGLALMGQRPQAAPSPAGWPDRADDWLGPEAVWQRVEWAQRLADRVGGTVDARALAQASLGPLLSEASRLQIERAADGPQALTLLLMAPEFQRR